MVAVVAAAEVGPESNNARGGRRSSTYGSTLATRSQGSSRVQQPCSATPTLSPHSASSASSARSTPRLLRTSSPQRSCCCCCCVCSDSDSGGSRRGAGCSGSRSTRTARKGRRGRMGTPRATAQSWKVVERERTMRTTVKTVKEAGGATASSQASANAPRRTTNRVRSCGRCSSRSSHYCPTTQTAANVETRTARSAASPAR